MGWGSNASTMQSLLQGKQEIQWYLKKEVSLLYRAGHSAVLEVYWKKL